MPITPPSLDDRQYADIVDEMMMLDMMDDMMD